MSYAFLPERGLIELAGEDVREFLQGLISNDARPLAEGKPVYAALLSPQGKFLHDFFLVPNRDSILVDCEKSRIADLLQRLKMYRLRSKVVIDLMPGAMRVAAIWGRESSGIKDWGMLRGYADPRLPQLGWRVIGEARYIEQLCARYGMEQADAAAYDRMRIDIGVPDGSRDMIVDKSLLLEYGFEDLHGVDFAKGCYVGQEVTARSKYRGQLKKHLYQLRSTAPLPQSGTAITLDGAAVGELRSHAGNAGLALMRVADVDKAGGMDFVCDGQVVKLALPSWVSVAPKALVIDE
jgi:folate-binding protein YgfZ